MVDSEVRYSTSCALADDAQSMTSIRVTDRRVIIFTTRTRGLVRERGLAGGGSGFALPDYQYKPQDKDF